MKRNVVLVLALFSLNIAHAQMQVSEKEAVLKTAKDQINLFIKDLPADGIADYGFFNKDEFEKISFGEPIPVYTMKDTTVVFTFTWRVPVVIEEEYRSLLTIIRENDSYQAVDFGATELAKAYALKRTPRTIGILRVYEIKADFLMEQPRSGNPVFIPLEFNR